MPFTIRYMAFGDPVGFAPTAPSATTYQSAGAAGFSIGPGAIPAPKPRWQILGWPSEAAYVAAGSPDSSPPTELTKAVSGQNPYSEPAGPPAPTLPPAQYPTAASPAGFDQPYQTPAGPPVPQQGGGFLSSIGNAVGDVGNYIKNAVSFSAQHPINYQPVAGVSGLNGLHETTPADIYNATNAPSQFLGSATPQLIPGAPGRILGSGLETATSPINLGLAAATGQPEFLARGFLSGAGYQGAQEAGAPEPIKQAAAIAPFITNPSDLTSVSGILKAAARTAAVTGSGEASNTLGLGRTPGQILGGPLSGIGESFLKGAVPKSAIAPENLGDNIIKMSDADFEKQIQAAAKEMTDNGVPTETINEGIQGLRDARLQAQMQASIDNLKSGKPATETPATGNTLRDQYATLAEEAQAHGIEVPAAAKTSGRLQSQIQYLQYQIEQAKSSKVNGEVPPTAEPLQSNFFGPPEPPKPPTGLSEPSENGVPQQPVPPEQANFGGEFQPNLLSGQTDFTGVQQPSENPFSLNQLRLNRGLQTDTNFESPAANPNAPNLSMREQPTQIGLKTAEEGSIPAGQPLTPELKAQAQRAIADRIAANRQAALAGKPQEAGSIIDNILSIPGAAMTLNASADVGNILRQGLTLGAGDPVALKNMAVETIKAFTSQDAADFAEAGLEMSGWKDIRGGVIQGLGWDDAAKDGTKLHIFGYGPDVKPSERVPGFTGRLNTRVSRAVEGLGFTAASERAFATGLNVEGVEVYEKYMNSLVKMVTNDGQRELQPSDRAFLEQQSTALKKTINHARGYGGAPSVTLGKGISVFFSARNAVSKFQVALDPLIQPGSLFQPTARQLAAKNLASLISGNVAMLGFMGLMSQYSGGAWTVSNDPQSSDFGKLKVGNTRYDLTAGFAPILRLFVRESLNASDKSGLSNKLVGHNLRSSTNANDWRTQITNFLQSKEAPIPALFTKVLTGHSPYGSAKLKVSDLTNLLQPFLMQDVYSAFNTTQGPLYQKILQGGSAGAASFFGAGVNSYPPNGSTSTTTSSATPDELQQLQQLLQNHQ